MEPSPEPPRSAMESASASACASASTYATTVDAPPESSIATAHLARFEFSDLGTKILMVEWHPGAAAAASSSPSAHSSTGADHNTETDTTVAADANPTTGGTLAVTHAPSTPLAPKPAPNTDAAPIPGAQAIKNRDSVSAADATVWEVSWPGKSTFLPARDTDQDEVGTRRRVYFLLPPEASIPTNVTITPPGQPSILVKPLPAIFPPGFNVESGTRGVLHTLWAKKRLSELQCEMDAEMRANAESVGLEMALTEKQWIIDNFLPPPSSPAPMSPRSSVPGRLGDKLKGLRLATSPEDLMPSATANTFTGADVPSQTLSPSGGDIAVSSFSAISRGNGLTQAMSLNAAIQGDTPAIDLSSRDDDDDLFALPLSPRSPEMKRSPFSALS
ncbi:hypothetical protein X797_005772 [Metarhizium robertsii]|uniref:Uncharacterized protein n=2 Tax=Metarhizium robertsii TaxID=568076 RepID=E9EL69_METRA|nr:uncharacterized protein MAA_00210 [Metarhizium robertsii ARSEF 23]EFZ03136.1 hypothetical protein MAA_00210 [Metarhizium robertsii ARSEF 23]EXV01199.1 hypothetical protein X797_005772 [Metarhizium robertsii]